MHIIGLTGTLLSFPPDRAEFTTIGHQYSFKWFGNPTFQTVNGIPTVLLNGVDQGAESDSDSYWSVGNGMTDDPFTLVVWLKPATDFVDGNVFGKYMIRGPQIREWLLQFETADSVIGVIRDESSGGGYKPRWTGLPAKGTWWMLALTYDGGGTIGGMELWYQGQPVKSSETDYNGYVAMENTAAPVTLGYSWLNGQPFGFFKGEIAGGPCGPIFTKKELSKGDLLSLYGLCSPYLN